MSLLNYSSVDCTADVVAKRPEGPYDYCGAIAIACRVDIAFEISLTGDGTFFFSHFCLLTAQGATRTRHVDID